MKHLANVFLIIIVLLFLAFLGFYTIACIRSYIVVLGKQSAIKAGIVVEATLVEVNVEVVGRGGYSTSSSHIYNLRYEYIDENGLKYYGDSGIWDYNREGVEGHLGEKVEIYIDGKGNSVAVGKNFDSVTSLILTIVMPIVFLGVFLGISAFCYIFIVKPKIEARKHEKEKKDMEEFKKKMFGA